MTQQPDPTNPPAPIVVQESTTKKVANWVIILALAPLALITVCCLGALLLGGIGSAVNH